MALFSSRSTRLPVTRCDGTSAAFTVPPGGRRGDVAFAPVIADARWRRSRSWRTQSLPSAAMASRMRKAGVTPEVSRASSNRWRAIFENPVDQAFVEVAHDGIGRLQVVQRQLELLGEDELSPSFRRLCSPIRRLLLRALDPAPSISSPVSERSPRRWRGSRKPGAARWRCGTAGEVEVDRHLAHATLGQQEHLDGIGGVPQGPVQHPAACAPRGPDPRAPLGDQVPIGQPACFWRGP